MKIFAILGLTLLVLVIGAFAFIGMSDAPVTQTTLTRDIETAPASAPTAPIAPAVTAPIASPAPVAETAPTAPVSAPVSSPTAAPTE